MHVVAVQGRPSRHEDGNAGLPPLIQMIDDGGAASQLKFPNGTHRRRYSPNPAACRRACHLYTSFETVSMTTKENKTKITKKTFFRSTFLRLTRCASSQIGRCLSFNSLPLSLPLSPSLFVFDSALSETIANPPLIPIRRLL